MYPFHTTLTLCALYSAIHHPQNRAITLSLNKSEWEFQSDTECQFNITLDGQCPTDACGLWIGFGNDSEYILVHVSIDGGGTNEMIAAPSSASGDITSFFTKGFKDNDFEDEADTVFNASVSSWDSVSNSDDGWPVELTFRTLNG